MGVATAIVGSALIGAGSQAYGARKAAKAQQAGLDAATAEQRRQYDQTREDLAPWRESGGNALARMDRAMRGDYSDFRTGPGYNFRKAEGMRDIGNIYSSGPSGVYSGNALRELTNFNQNLASTEFGNWWNRNVGMSEAGRGATNTTAMMGQRSADNISRNYMARGQADANRWMNTASGINNAAQAGIGNYLYAKNRGWFDAPEERSGVEPINFMGTPYGSADNYAHMRRKPERWSPYGGH